jgi:hypothetical protein
VQLIDSPIDVKWGATRAAEFFVGFSPYVQFDAAVSLGLYEAARLPAQSVRSSRDNSIPAAQAGELWHSDA